MRLYLLLVIRCLLLYICYHQEVYWFEPGAKQRDSQETFFILEDGWLSILTILARSTSSSVLTELKFKLINSTLKTLKITEEMSLLRRSKTELSIPLLNQSEINNKNIILYLYLNLYRRKLFPTTRTFHSHLNPSKKTQTMINMRARSYHQMTSSFKLINSLYIPRLDMLKFIWFIFKVFQIYQTNRTLIFIEIFSLNILRLNFYTLLFVIPFYLIIFYCYKVIMYSLIKNFRQKKSWSNFTLLVNNPYL